MSAEDEPPRRKRAGLKLMADTVFDESCKIYARNRQLGDKGFPGYPRPDEMRKAEIYEDIAKLLDVLREIQGDVRELIRNHQDKKKADADKVSAEINETASKQDMT